MSEYSFKVRFELDPVPHGSSAGDDADPGVYHAALHAIRRFVAVGGDFAPAGDFQEITVTQGDFTASARYTGGKESAVPITAASWPMFREEHFVVRVERSEG